MLVIVALKDRSTSNDNSSCASVSDYIACNVNVYGCIWNAISDNFLASQD